jgi:glycosyltransferase involved in cell wall biosynthesis
MKIGIQADALHGRRTGVGNYCLNMLLEIARRDPAIAFFSAGVSQWCPVVPDQLDGPELAAPDTTRAVKAQAIEFLRRNLRQRHYARVAHRFFTGALRKRVYRSRDIELFHAFNYLPPIQPVVPVLPVVYDLSFIRYPGMHPTERLRQLSGLGHTLDRAPLIHTISEFSKREIIDVYGVPADRIFVAYPGAAPHFRQLGREASAPDLARLDLNWDSYLLAVGTIEPRKNLKTLIAAYASLPARDQQRFPLVIVGNPGWGEHDLPDQTDALIRAGRVRFVGFQPDATLRSLYEGCRVMLYPSIYEGFGMPVVEAMACGAPVAHSADASMDEIGGSLAIRVPALDVDAWAECLRQAVARPGPIDDNERAALIARAGKFHWASGAGVIHDAYTRVVGAAS